MSDLLTINNNLTASGYMFDVLDQAPSGCLSVWDTGPAGEGNPRRVIRHSRALRLAAPARLDRLGVKPGDGYHKCCKFLVRDRVTSLRMLSWNGTEWECVLQEANLPDGPSWFDLGGRMSSSVIIEALECAVDRGWTGWNLVSSAFELEGQAPELIAYPPDRFLTVACRDLSGCPEGVDAFDLPGEIRYRTAQMEVGFRLGRPGFSHLAFNDEALKPGQPSLLRMTSMNDAIYRPFDAAGQGLMLHPVGRAAAIGLTSFSATGTTRVEKNTVTYDVEVPEAGQRYRLRWEVMPDRLVLSVDRHADAPLRAWVSSAWSVSLDSRVTPCTMLGAITGIGQTGLLELPLLLHAPGYGTLRITSKDQGLLWRSDSTRPSFTTIGELKLGEAPQPEGDYLLLAGCHHAEIEFRVVQNRIPLSPDVPAVVQRAIDRCSLTGLTYRPDTGTFTNNGNSMHAIICADCWSDEAKRIGRILPNLSAGELLRDTLSRWLDGGPGYANGPVVKDAHVHYMEDEYLMSGTAALLGLADYLECDATGEWVASYQEQIAAELDRMRGRDIDGDGLIESAHRLGISGERKWSTAWFDEITFGWKDAFANALLYPALMGLAESLPRLGQARLASGLREWAESIRTSYRPTFFNPESGWLAGWRCKDDRLHDYGFLFVNGAAINAGLIEPVEARQMMERLYGEWEGLGLDARLGLPGALRPIPFDDLALPMRLGVYQNGSLTHSQSRHFVRALYQVGMTAEADRILEALLSTLADGSAFGGCGSGVDWRQWDGQPSGYEGLLSDQFGILAVALERYAAGQ